ncbi:MAG: CoA transferase, partial [Solimonas sp.]
LGGMRVLRIGDGLGAAYGAKLLRGFGATVRSIALPEAPVADISAEERAWYEVDQGRLPFDGSPAALNALLHGTDVVIDASAPGVGESLGLEAEALAKRHPRLIVCRVTPFGIDGPYRDYAAADITLYAMSGLMNSTGDGTREPLHSQPKIAQVTAGLYAYIATVMALLRREQDGLGDYIDLSIHEASMENYENAIAEHLHAGNVARRNGDEHTMVPWRTYRCADGEAAIIGGPIRNWGKAAELFGAPELVEQYSRMDVRIKERKSFEALLRPWLEANSKRDIFLAGQQRGLAWSYLATIKDALDDPQHTARQFFVKEKTADGREARVPGAPFRGSESRWQGDGETPSRATPAAGKAPSKEPLKAPLQGLRVLDFTHDWAGPHAVRVLGDYGAEIIKIEYPKRLDGMRGGYPKKVNEFARFWQLHRNKRSLTLDLARPDHLEICLKLARDADVVVENSRPGVMDKLGLGYEALRKANPDIVMVSMSAFGVDGPYARFAGYGGTIEAISGLQALTAYSADGPAFRVREMDVLNGIFGSCAAVTALLHRQRGGRGQWIDLSETETCCWTVGEFFAQASLSGHEPPVLGNRHVRHAPQGCYPAAGTDRWLTVSIADDAQWQRFARIIGGDALAGDARYASVAQRRAQHDALDALIAAWTGQQDAAAAMQTLQQAGIAAGMVCNAKDLAQDPHLAARGWFQSVDGIRLPGFPFRMRRGGGVLNWRGPDLGRDNAHFASYGELALGDTLAPDRLGTAFE